MIPDRGSPYPLIRIPYPFRPAFRRPPRLRVDLSLSHTGVFDGGWWPRSRRIERELPGLVVALRPVIGPVVTFGEMRSVWEMCLFIGMLQRSACLWRGEISIPSPA